MAEKLNSSERNFALDREAAFRKYRVALFANYAGSSDKANIIASAQRYVYSHENSKKPIEQGRVDACQAFLDSVSR